MEFHDGILVITDSISINATVVEWTLQHFSVGLRDLRIVTQASLLEGNLYFKSSSLSAIVSISEKPGFHNQLWLLELAKVIKPGGSVFVQEPSFFEENKEIAFGESRSSLERNLIFAGFSSLEGSECLDHSAEICSSPQSFGLIAIKAKRPWNTDTSIALQKGQMQKSENSVVAFSSKVQPQIDGVDDLIDEDTLLTIDDSKKPELPLDNSYLLRERIRERNRLYQRRRRARMTEEQRERERERRRQYMQSRRVHSINYEILPISYQRPEECNQSPQCAQQLREAQVIEMEKKQVMGEAGEAL